MSWDVPDPSAEEIADACLNATLIGILALISYAFGHIHGQQIGKPVIPGTAAPPEWVGTALYAGLIAITIFGVGKLTLYAMDDDETTDEPAAAGGDAS